MPVPWHAPDATVRFVGTATIGTDHLDIGYLENRGVRWCYSPGCNANSVSEYLTAALLCLADRHGFTLEGNAAGLQHVAVTRQPERELGVLLDQHDRSAFAVDADEYARDLLHDNRRQAE